MRQELDRDTKQILVNFDAYLYSQADVDKAMKALEVAKVLLPVTEPVA